jgi:hypothetical protein
VIASPPDDPGEHLRLLAAISRWLGRGTSRVRSLVEASSRQAVISLLEETA